MENIIFWYISWSSYLLLFRTTTTTIVNLIHHMRKFYPIPLHLYPHPYQTLVIPIFSFFAFKVLHIYFFTVTFNMHEFTPTYMFPENKYNHFRFQNSISKNPIKHFRFVSKFKKCFIHKSGLLLICELCIAI